MASASPTARTLKACRDRGWRAQSVEKYNFYTKRSTDLFGFIDLVVLDDGDGCLGIQATSDNSGGHGGARIRKIIDGHADAAFDWLVRRNRLEIWAWKKRKLKRGGRAVRWKCNRTAIYLDEFGHLAAERVEDV